MNVSIIALGNWGTALGNYLAQRGHQVLGWSNEEAVVTSINKTHRNTKYLQDIELNKNFKATSILKDALSAPVVLLAFPSAGLATLLPKLTFQPHAIVVSAIKGFESETLMTPLQYLSSKVTTPIRPVVFSGPSFAKDIVRGNPAGVVAASKDEGAARELATIFSGGAIKVYLSDDPLGVEIGGAVKNVIALGVGVCDGLALGDSARAGLITRGLAEMIRLGVCMGADARTLSGLSGLGDLVMTATCDTSRNRCAGLLLAKGHTVPQILNEIGSAIEGIHTTPLVLRLARQYGIEMPITEQMAKLLNGEVSASDAARALITRPIKKESD